MVVDREKESCELVLITMVMIAMTVGMAMILVVIVMVMMVTAMGTMVETNTRSQKRICIKRNNSKCFRETKCETNRDGKMKI